MPYDDNWKLGDHIGAFAGSCLMDLLLHSQVVSLSLPFFPLTFLFPYSISYFVVTCSLILLNFPD